MVSSARDTPAKACLIAEITARVERPDNRDGDTAATSPPAPASIVPSSDGLELSGHWTAFGISPLDRRLDSIEIPGAKNYEPHHPLCCGFRRQVPAYRSELALIRRLSHQCHCQLQLHQSLASFKCGIILFCLGKCLQGIFWGINYESFIYFR